MTTEFPEQTTFVKPVQKKRSWLIVILVCVLLTFAVYAGFYAPSSIAYRNYTPQEGDVIFQSLPQVPLVRCIEGATRSPYSHCGIVGKKNGKWVVYEALGKVKATPLRKFCFQGRNRGFAVYRLKEEHQKKVPATLDETRKFLGRPYDSRYRMDEKKIYCSELIYKAYRNATGGELLGELVKLGDLNWEPYVETIIKYEGGPVPKEREMITPYHLSQADQLERVYVYKLKETTRKQSSSQD